MGWNMGIKKKIVCIFFIVSFFIVNGGFTLNKRFTQYIKNTSLKPTLETKKNLKKMKIYKINTSRFSFDEFINYIKNHFGVSGKNKKSYTTYRIFGSKYYFKYSLIPGSIQMSLLDDSFSDKIISKSNSFPSYTVCRILAEEAITKYKLNKPWLFFSGISDDRKYGGYEIYVNFCRQIDHIDCLGAGNVLSIAINESGEISNILLKWQQIEQLDEYKIISPKIALNKLKEGIGRVYIEDEDTKLGNVLKYNIIYRMNGLEYEKFALPWYEFEIEKNDNTKYSSKEIKAYAPALEKLNFYLDIDW